MARPEISIKCFPLEAAAWAHTNDDGRKRYSTKITKRVKKVDQNTGEASYEDSPFFDQEDLLKVAALAQEMHRRTSIEDRT